MTARKSEALQARCAFEQHNKARSTRPFDRRLRGSHGKQCREIALRARSECFAYGASNISKLPDELASWTMSAFEVKSKIEAEQIACARAVIPLPAASRGLGHHAHTSWLCPRRRPDPLTARHLLPTSHSEFCHFCLDLHLSEPMLFQGTG